MHTWPCPQPITDYQVSTICFIENVDWKVYRTKEPNAIQVPPSNDNREVF